MSYTHSKIKKVSKVEEFISFFQKTTFDSLKLRTLHKTLKTVKLAITDRFVIKHTNTKLFEVNTQKQHCV